MLEEYMELALAAAKEAGGFLKLKKQIEIDSNTGKDIKLSSDRLSEKIILDKLSTSGIPVLAEEGGLIGERGQFCWIVDPLDGTVNYYKGLDDFCCVSIALWKDGQPVLGVINRFASNEVFSGIVGGGAFLNGEPIRPSDTAETSCAVMATGFPVNRDYSDDGLGKFIRQVQYFKKVRMFGAAAIMGVYVSCGRLDAYFEEDIMIWDVAAAMAIVKAAGGVTSFQINGENRCTFRCFATQGLMDDFISKGLL